MPMIHPAFPRPTSRRRQGFTLIETSMALVIIGVGVLAFVDAQNSFIRNNAWSSQAATASLLAGEVRELTRKLSRHDPVTGLTLLGSGPTATLVGWGPEVGETGPADFDDIDDFDGARFGDGGTYDGPINAYAGTVPRIDADGNIVLDENGDPLPMTGWSQTVTVEKVDPFNYSLVRAKTFTEAANGPFPGRTVDGYPLRVTVSVEYRASPAAQASEITRMVWIVP